MKKQNIAQAEEIPYLKTLLYIASVDGTLSDNELLFFSKEGAAVGLQDEEIESAIDWIKDKKESLDVIVKGIKSKETKITLISRLLELCYSDDDYSLPEKSGMTDLCILLNLDLKELNKLENKAELNYRMKQNSKKIKSAGDSASMKLSKALKEGKNNAEQLGKKIADGSSDVAHSVALGIGVIGSKIAFTFENAKKVKEENKELRERLQKDNITEAVKQKVVLQLHSKIQALSKQLANERQRNDLNEEMIRLLQEQIADFEMTVDIAESIRTS